MNNLEFNFVGWSDRDKILTDLLHRFGSMNKNDYEVTLFHLLLEYKFKGKSDFDISVQLQIPESKVKRLRYESYLHYPIKNEQCLNQLKELIEYKSYKFDSTKKTYSFSIPDKFIRLYLENILNANNTFSDSSFNNHIVILTATDLTLLLLSLYEGDDKTAKSVLDDIKKHVQKDSPLSNNFSYDAKKALNAIINSAGNVIITKLIDQLIKAIV